MVSYESLNEVDSDSKKFTVSRKTDLNVLTKFALLFLNSFVQQLDHYFRY